MLSKEYEEEIHRELSPLFDGIEHFYYFKAQVRGQWVRLNVAKRVLSQPNGKKQIQYFLYSINDIKNKSTEGGS